MVTITDEVLGANCNEFSILITGTDDYVTTLAANAVTYGWSDDVITTLTEYSDGYHITASQTITTTPVASGPTYQGMCFAVDDTTTEGAVLGGFCVAYVSADTATESAA